MTKEELSQQLADLHKQMEEQEKVKTEIKLSQEYLDLQKTIEESQEAQKAMLSTQPDLSIMYTMLKEQAIEIMRNEEIDHFGVLSAKYKESNAVNKNKLLDMLGGDIGTFMELSEITQKSLKDFVKISNNKGLLNAIECTDRKLVDIEIINLV